MTVRHLLSGIARCGVCGSVCGAVMNRGAPSYACKGDSRAWRGSRHVVRRQLPVDLLVVDNVMEWFARPGAARAYANATEAASEEIAAARDELEALERKLEGFRQSALKPVGGIPLETLERYEAHYGPLIAAARERTKPRVVPPIIREGLAALDLEAWWEGLPMVSRRLVVRTLVTVTIHKSAAPRGTKGFDPELVAVDWI